MSVIRPNPLLVLSSLCFVVPITLNAVKQQWALYSVNMSVMLLSSLYHATKWPPLFYPDACVGYLLSFIHFHHSLLTGYYLITFPVIMYCLFIFWYGFKYKCLIWNPDPFYATLWHLSFHGVVVLTITYIAATDSRF